MIQVNIPTLETERLEFRAPSEDIFADEIEFWQSDRSAGMGGPEQRDLVWRQIAAVIGHWVMRGYGRWAVYEKATGKYCGLVGLWYPDGWFEPEIAWAVMQHAEGRGIAYEAAVASRRYAYKELGWTTAISSIALTNSRSKALAERMGATLERTYEHPSFGTMEVWRHKGPEELS
ncbi:MAG: GNAT family N-acetyltransferase [Pseudomonadota bacterium]